MRPRKKTRHRQLARNVCIGGMMEHSLDTSGLVDELVATSAPQFGPKSSNGVYLPEGNDFFVLYYQNQNFKAFCAIPKKTAKKWTARCTYKTMSMGFCPSQRVTASSPNFLYQLVLSPSRKVSFSLYALVCIFWPARTQAQSAHAMARKDTSRRKSLLEDVIYSCVHGRRNAAAAPLLCHSCGPNEEYVY